VCPNERVVSDPIPACEYRKYYHNLLLLLGVIYWFLLCIDKPAEKSKSQQDRHKKYEDYYDELWEKRHKSSGKEHKGSRSGAHHHSHHSHSNRKR